mmetsp:Transcript_26183/g.54656  ORF Transcript_26183/g.54656 Transcript_26183/m.54656 type:complete len:95 (+) Transcript_26183:211-495(+)
MKLQLLLPAFLLACSTLLLAAKAQECQVDGVCTGDEKETPEPLECRVYMAPSTLGEKVNMGIYTGVDLKESEVVQEEIAIPLFFRHWGKIPNVS